MPATIQEQVDEAIGHGFDGMIVYVDQAGKPPAFYTGGWKDRVSKVAADPHALFKIASISKLYVAVSITKLAKSDRLNLDDSVADYFPEYADQLSQADKITVRMLVQHRSGIPDFTYHPDYWGDEQSNRLTPMKFALDMPIRFNPGESYQYSNTNYFLLRNIIQKVLGYSHHQYIQEEILNPLGLKNTFSSIKDVDLERVMSGYYAGVEDDFKENDNGMLASAEDVGLFLRALNKGTVFKPGEKALYDTLYVYEHGGLVPGYQSLAEYHEDIDTVVVQFINTTDFTGYEWNLSEIVLGRIVKILKQDAE
ncbi:serine hydrolase domain-containing protein [uncultured Pseudoteredinibacter sp.]|uniref:serine hydrolase domain-containing protein n=1 Tax=uncultured Pseudoteredinibacter sp. TaxID=1641701 RepID=UPI00260E7970|nr:serine hydrolase domain-containing protein [uncultured Pseudoteredinibacter sp.]